MDAIIMPITIIGFYFMLGSQDAYTRFKVSYRNQNIYLMCMFGLYGLINIARIFAFVSAGLAFPFFALIMLGLDAYLVNLYYKKL